MATTFKLLVELPITLVQESSGTQTGTTVEVPPAGNGTVSPSNVFDEIFLKNPTTGGYIRVFAEPSASDADSRILSQPSPIP